MGMLVMAVFTLDECFEQTRTAGLYRRHPWLHASGHIPSPGRSSGTAGRRGGKMLNPKHRAVHPTMVGI